VICLDTNAVIGLISGRAPKVRDSFAAALEAGADFGVPALVMHELLFGIAKSARRDANRQLLNSYLAIGASFLPLDESDAREAAEIRTVLERAGTPIGPFDLLIAAQVRRRGAVLITANVREFSRVGGLIWQNWADDPKS
jgi:tRNA(fMet)-specific endonuclease VapC